MIKYENMNSEKISIITKSDIVVGEMLELFESSISFEHLEQFCKMNGFVLKNEKYITLPSNSVCQIKKHIFNKKFLYEITLKNNFTFRFKCTDNEINSYIEIV